jgi:excisionase family DNA binding protein
MASTNQEVLTLSEAADYLRVSEETLRQLASEKAIPAREVGGEWRFLKSALQDWLRRDAAVEDRRRREGSSRARLLELAGVWKDDPSLDEMLREICRQRGTPMTVTGRPASSP